MAERRIGTARGELDDRGPRRRGESLPGISRGWDGEPRRLEAIQDPILVSLEAAWNSEPSH